MIGVTGHPKQLADPPAELRIGARLTRLGQTMAEQKATVGVNKGTAGKGRPKIGGLPKNPPKDTPPTLADAGIDKYHILRAAGREGTTSGRMALASTGEAGEWVFRVGSGT